MTTHAKPTVFISYSHRDEQWKNLLTPHLKVLAQAGRIDIWDDRKIDGGSQWFHDIKEAIDRAAVAVCLISADYLASDFCVKEEIPYLLERRDRTVLVILPTLLHPCVWEVVEWLKNTQMIPRDGKSISADFKGNENEAFRQVAKSVLEIADDPNRRRPEPPPPNWPVPDKVDTKRLPVTGSELFGRQKELKMLDEAWESGGTRVVGLVAWGGVGKSTLVNKWLEQLEADNYRGARRVYAWSFYSQGTNERITSADLFINNALEFFGDPDPTAGSPWDKGERLARLVQEEKTLLLLDGLEPLQSPHAHERGKIKDPALSTLLTDLARGTQGLCLITTREPVTDLDEFPETVLHKDLEQISDEAGRALLRVGGVRGTDAELEQATRDFGNHALAVQLLAVYLRDIPGHHVSRAAEIPDLDIPEEQGKQPRRLLAAFEQRFGAGPEVELLRILGLFDRPADRASLQALRRAPAIPNLSDHIRKLSEAGWLRLVDKLRRHKLIAPEGRHSPDTLDAHPLVRQHFGQYLKRFHPRAWQGGNSRLYEHLRRSVKVSPKSIEQMSPLYAAVTHGCEAGRHGDALKDVYIKRILKENEYFSVKKLGAYAADLAALRCFFSSPWHQAVDTLTDIQKAHVLQTAGMALRALGQLEDAVLPMEIGLGLIKSVKSPDGLLNAPIVAKNMCELFLAIGDLSRAQDYGAESVRLADTSGNAYFRMRGDDYYRVVTRATLANVMHHSGDSSEAEAIFREAEELQKRHQPHYPYLYSVAGCQYCDLLLSQGKYQEVLERVTQILKWDRADLLFENALEHLILGKALMLQACEEGATDFTQAADQLERAVIGLRYAGRQDHLPRGLLSRANLRSRVNDENGALADVTTAMAIAERGGMGLHQADCNLAYARLFLAQDEREKAQEHWRTAKVMIKQMGYHLRDRDVEEIGREFEGA